MSIREEGRTVFITHRRVQRLVEPLHRCPAVTLVAHFFPLVNVCVKLALDALLVEELIFDLTHEVVNSLQVLRPGPIGPGCHMQLAGSLQNSKSL